MSDKAASRDTSKDSIESQADAVDVSSSFASGLASKDENFLAVPQVPYGPAPKPVPQPAIFDQIYKTPVADFDPLLSSSSSPSFNLSAQGSASPPVNTVSFQPGSHGEQPLPGMTGDTPVPESSIDCEAGAGGAKTISVESQCDSPSLDDLAGMDISEASREELMVYHSELMGWIRELESALQDCQSDFKAHLQQFGQQELLLEQRTQELLVFKERHVSLNQEVDVQQKAHQRQTILVETLQEQLNSSQERVAQMERDFSQVQRRCSDQAQQLLQAEGLCRDLKSRLSRQQRHTMQFKAALEKSLAVSVSDSDYDLGDLDMDSMESSGELFPRPKPVRPWSDQLDEAALAPAFDGLDSPDELEQPAVTKGLNLQLAFENPEAADLKAAQTKAASKAQMAYGNAAMGLTASQAIAANEAAAEPVFDPEQAEDLEATLKQESESILQGELLGSEAGEENGQASQAPLVTAKTVAFVPPITPVLPEEAAEQPEAQEEAEEVAVGQPVASDTETPATAEKKRTTLAGISLPSFPRF